MSKNLIHTSQAFFCVWGLKSAFLQKEMGNEPSKEVSEFNITSTNWRVVYRYPSTLGLDINYESEPVSVTDWEYSVLN